MWKDEIFSIVVIVITIQPSPKFPGPSTAQSTGIVDLALQENSQSWQMLLWWVIYHPADNSSHPGVTEEVSNQNTLHSCLQLKMHVTAWNERIHTTIRMCILISAQALHPSIHSNILPSRSQQVSSKGAPIISHNTLTKRVSSLENEIKLLAPRECWWIWMKKW